MVVACTGGREGERPMDDREYGMDIVLGELFHEETFKLRHMDGWMGPLDEGSTIFRGDLTEHEFLQAWVSLPAIPISIDVDFDSNNHAGIAVGGAGGANSAQDL